MTEARAFKCPVCGGEVDERERVCTYCASPIATVRCAHCFHMNVPDAAHCSACGRQLGLEPIGKRGDLLCPHCEQPFEAFTAGPGLLHDCPTCGGQFVEHELLRDLLERREVYGQVAPRPIPQANPLHQSVKYVPCPVCRALMNRKNFGRSSGVIVDICQKHGVWFDSGELPRVMAFVEAGGLAQAKRREEEEQRLARTSTATGAMAAMPPLTTADALPGMGGRSRAEAEIWEELADAGSALLGFLANAVRRDV